MAKFNVSTLNTDLSTIVPQKADMKLLVDAFMDAVTVVANRGDVEYLESFSSGIGETRMRGVARRLTPDQRAEAIDLLMPEISEQHSSMVRLVERLLDTSPNLPAMSHVIELVGFERFEQGPAGKWLGERAALARCATELRGEEFLIDVDANPEEAHEAVERIHEVLRHNVDVFERWEEQTKFLPMAFNARKLLEAFEQAREQAQWSDDPLELAAGWNERIKIHTSTGIAVLDAEALRWTAEELRELRQGIERFPAYVPLLENVVLNISLQENPPENPEALGGYMLGKIRIFEAVRRAQAGIHYHDYGVGPVEVAGVREMSHTAHTVCMMDFQKLSGWIRVNDWSFNDPVTGRRILLAPDDFQPGSSVRVGDQEYIVSHYEEPTRFDFGWLGNDELSIQNPYTPKGSGYMYVAGARFPTEYAAVEPAEDYAETLTMFLLAPHELKEKAPEKFDFMDFLYGTL
jgi:hypothetical protein